VRGGGTLGRGEIEALSVPGIPLTEAVFQRITVLPPPERELAVQKLASALTLARIDYLLQATEDELRVIAHEPENNDARELLEARIASLRAAGERLRALRQHADRLAEAVTAIDQAARPRAPGLGGDAAHAADASAGRGGPWPTPAPGRRARTHALSLAP
jgi:hypothetical protein